MKKLERSTPRRSKAKVGEKCINKCLSITVNRYGCTNLDCFNLEEEDHNFHGDNGLAIYKEGSANFGCSHLEEEDHEDSDGSEDQVLTLKLNSFFQGLAEGNVHEFERPILVASKHIDEEQFN
ncbi:hypothetical protein GH714_022394 [Hevea brasiliensis]|uniref:Uncharacterized protein n=1 Tax=Hevea brasiliensis TaxID=3981 RepID=A0A6A6N024_HEVBR|nr:hypothetical protein GH714_022394 [Hevea brasiliensis]